MREEGETEEPAEPAGSGPESASLVGWAASTAWKLASKGPKLTIKLARRGFDEAEKLTLSTLKRRMDAVAAADESEPGDDEVRGAPRAAPAEGHASATAAMDAATLLAQLLEASQTQTQSSARELLALRTLRQLVPDEVRILAALADGHGAPLMHLGAGPLVGPATQRWMENLSPIGKEAGVSLPDQVPTYITHLRELGLLESGDEDKSVQIKYQILEGDTKLRQASEEIEKEGLRPKLFRRTIKMSAVGLAFWAACEPKEKKSW